MTLAELIAQAAARLAAAHQAGQLAFGHGTTNAHDEAAWLVLWKLALPLDCDLGSEGARSVSTAEARDALALIDERIATRKPAAYLTREAWLQGVPFYVDERTIVPRSFIAELIADADGQGTLDAWLGEDTSAVLDLCTGNGSLAVLAALAWPEVRVDGADISDEALAVARINIDKHGLQERVQLLKSDGLAQVARSYDLILCNPPYVNQQSMTALPAEYRAEPELALAGGADGMDFIRRLLRDAPARMSAHAVLVLEIGNEREHYEAAFPALAARTVWLDTSAGADQVLLLTREALDAAAPGADTPR
ncbi:50S ribosomal protein L3 N(5)-glutamine methyltransferase [Hylemonella gracilis]|uniref:N5-glutamine S-adenosyl-L-methionine-dependent methyltransferase n=1 Tax=Hylemonella gracilis ATCC 19624 TaxID=887062 RepID=F3KRA0_9BURK|nr:50S ribosomal protein L3 N(5)-glutamine methyltransferase [Hylemonella gracilis]EGI77801.1 N5-glutamine S-adenosyl-L-methionine-dependent methyltransferase [Hylemonella gracilis ATCC 19624]